MPYEEAIRAVPAEAEPLCTFGYPGEPGYAETWRMPDGTRYWVENGTTNAKAWGVRIVRPLGDG